MFIREMVVNDLDCVVELEKQLFTSAWEYNDFLYEIKENQFAFYYVLVDHDQIIGYVGLWMMYEQSQITTIGVDQHYQGHGYGHQLLNEMIKIACQHQCDVMSLEVRVSNHTAIRLYESCGFEKVTLRKDYYQDNHEDAYLMLKRLEGKS